MKHFKTIKVTQTKTDGALLLNEPNVLTSKGLKQQKCLKTWLDYKKQNKISFLADSVSFIIDLSFKSESFIKISPDVHKIFC